MIGFNFFAQNIPPELYLLAFGVLIIVGFLIYYFRQQIVDTLGIGAAKKTILEQEIEQRLVQIRQLYRQENFKAAAVLMWQTMTLASEGFLGVGRAPNESARQLGVKLMNRGDIDPSAVNAMIVAFEKARYGETPLTNQEFKDGLSGLHQFLQMATSLGESVLIAE
jgi:alcohol dehydrogenase YqhD (iron-dependent ADH family)